MGVESFREVSLPNITTLFAKPQRVPHRFPLIALGRANPPAHQSQDVSLRAVRGIAEADEVSRV